MDEQQIEQMKDGIPLAGEGSVASDLLAKKEADDEA